MTLNEHPNHDEATVSMKVVLLAFAVVLVGALGYLVMAQNRAVDTTGNSSAVVTPKTETITTDETADWKTYVSSTLGISFKYPSDWKVAERDNGTIEITNTAKAYSVENSAVVPIQVSVKADTYGSDINKYYTNVQVQGITKESLTKVGGQTTYETIGTTAPTCHDNRTVFVHEKVYGFANLSCLIKAGASSTVTGETDASLVTDVFTKLLSTVKFTN